MGYMKKKEIGKLVRVARKTLGLSQMKLAEKIGVSYQQVQKYESGKSEISITRFCQLASALNIPVKTLMSQGTMISEPTAPYGSLENDEIEFLLLFKKIKSKKLRNSLLILMQAMQYLPEESRQKKKTKRSSSER